jgi:hypothetical protein
MNEMHLTEEAIQQYVLEPWTCAQAAQAHMGNCAHCRQIASEYKLLFSGLKEQERPVFDFDPAELAGEAIEREVMRNRVPVFYLVAATIAAGLIAGLWWKWTLIKAYAAKYFQDSNSVTGFSKITLYITLIAACIIVLIQAFEIYGRYRKKVSELNFY